MASKYVGLLSTADIFSSPNVCLGITSVVIHSPLLTAASSKGYKLLLEKFCWPDTCFIFIFGNLYCLSFSKTDKSLHLHPWHPDLEAKNPIWESVSTEILLFARQVTPNQLLSYICPWPRGEESNRLRVRPEGHLVLPPFLHPSLPTYGGHQETPQAYMYCPKPHMLAVSSVNLF